MYILHFYLGEEIDLIHFLFFLHNLKDNKLQHRSTRGCWWGSEETESDCWTQFISGSGGWDHVVNREHTADLILDPARRSETSKEINRQNWTSLWSRAARLTMKGGIFQTSRESSGSRNRLDGLNKCQLGFPKALHFGVIELNALTKNLLFEFPSDIREKKKDS